MLGGGDYRGDVPAAAFYSKGKVPRQQSLLAASASLPVSVFCAMSTLLEFFFLTFVENFAVGRISSSETKNSSVTPCM